MAGSPASVAGTTPPANLVGSCAAPLNVVPYAGEFRLILRASFRDFEPTYDTSTTAPAPTFRCTPTL
jgi:hypothetical protein